MQMAQPRSWVQTPASHWPMQIPTAPQNPVIYVRTPVQHMNIRVAPVVRTPVAVRPPAPRWIYAAPLKQQGPVVRSIEGPNAAPKVVAMRVGTPQAKKDAPLIEGRVQTDEGIETIKPSDFNSMWQQNLFQAF